MSAVLMRFNRLYIRRCTDRALQSHHLHRCKRASENPWQTLAQDIARARSNQRAKTFGMPVIPDTATVAWQQR